MYDVYVPLIDMPKRTIPYEEGLDIIREGLAPLGSEYIERIERAAWPTEWIDVYEK
ncbi:MAG: hypothetical protein ACOX4I_09455 [Anaerovoracaceae bacterium]